MRPSDPDYSAEDLWKTFVPGLMRVVKKDMDQRCIEDIERYGLSKMHLGYLMMLSRGKVTMKALSEDLNMDKANTTRAIADLREKGLVTDDREKENNRKYNVFLTPEGEGLVVSLKEKVDRAFEDYMEGISPDEMAAFFSTLSKIKNNIVSEERSSKIACIRCCKKLK